MKTKKEMIDEMIDIQISEKYGYHMKKLNDNLFIPEKIISLKKLLKKVK